MTISSKSAERTACVSLILSVVFFFVTFFVGRWAGVFAVYAASWLILSAASVWFVLCLQFHQRSLAEQEKLDMSQLAKGEQDSTIFRAGDEQASMFAVAQRRLQLLEKWFLPFFSATIAIYQIGIGLYLLKTVAAVVDISPKQPLICAICMTAIAFVSFLVSRYATGMSAELQWKPLRAGGSIFLGIAILCFALAIALALAQFKIFVVVNIIGWVIPVLLLALGAETGLNVVLDVYRPRLKGRYSRSAFDSRLLGIINEPGRIFRTAADALDYQFGFNVSQTWFYKLLEKAVVPLVLLAALTLYLLSCIVVVAPNEEVIIEHFGNPTKTVGPGLAFKRPWPIDIAYKYPTKKVSEINIGFVPKINPKTKEAKSEPLLWGKAHYEKEELLLVASGQAGDKATAGAVPVSLVAAVVRVQYKIKDLYSFIYKNKDSEKLLESICYQELTRFAAGAKIEVDDGDDMNQSLLGAGRSGAGRILTDRIQAAVDEAGLGVEIIFVGMQGIHPPTEVAADYQKVVGAIQAKQAIILNAKAYRNKILSALAGSVEEANKLYSLAAEYQTAKEKNDPEQIEKLGGCLDTAFAEAKGDIFTTLRQAQSYAFEKATLAHATGQRFAGQFKAYSAAPEIYKRQLRLSVFEEALDNIRKFVVVADKNDMQIFEIDVKEKLTPSLYELSGFEENSGK